MADKNLNQPEVLAFIKFLHAIDSKDWYSSRQISAMRGCNQNRLGSKLVSLYRAGFIERKTINNVHYYRYSKVKRKGFNKGLK